MTIPQTGGPAKIWKRLVAGVIDFVLLAALVWPLVKLFGYGDVDVEIEFTRTALGRVFPYLLFTAMWLFPFCLRDLFAGRSPGKWLLGLRVVDSADGISTPTPRRLILRNLTIWLSPFGMTSAMMHADRMRFGDRLAHTMVVEESRSIESWQQTVFKGVCFAAAAMGCFLYWQGLTRRYHEGSRPFRQAEVFLDGCTELRELMPGLSSDNLTLAGFNRLPRAEGVEVWVDFRHRSAQRETAVRVVMTRPTDNVTAWAWERAAIQLNPPPVAENVTASTLNTSALDFLKSYEPLHAAVNDLHMEKTQLIGVAALVENEKKRAVVVYIHQPDRWSASVRVFLDRRDGGWEVSDALGLIGLNMDNAASRTIFAFASRHGLHRYLTAEEMGLILSGRKSPEEVIPELRPPEDALSAPGTDKPVPTGPSDKADNSTGMH